MRTVGAPVSRLVATVALITVLTATGVEAYSFGIIGYSGKLSDTCRQCHDDGVQPLVDFEGPMQFAADTVAEFRFVVQSQNERQRFAGFNVAASGGVLAIAADQDARVEDGELTHNAPQTNDAEGTSAWTFSWCLAMGGDYVLFGSGNSVNGNGNNSGDASKAAQLPVHVTPPAGDLNCDGRRSAADLTAVFTSVNAGVCETPQAGSGVGTAGDTDAVIRLLFAATCQSLSS